MDSPTLDISDFLYPQTSSEGSNWIEYLTGCFEGSPFGCTKHLWNFAFAGADITAALFALFNTLSVHEKLKFSRLPLHHNFTTSLVEQVNQWTKFASRAIPHPRHKTLTVWWIGINDTGDTFKNASITNFPAFWETEMVAYFDAVQLAQTNGLDTHLFINVPAEERNPSFVGSSNAAKFKQNIDQFNTVLAEHVQRFKNTNPDAVVMTFDSNALFNSILDSPTEFGFTNTTGFYTCADPTGFFWYNSGHPTQAVHKLIAQAIEAELRNPTFIGTSTTEFMYKETIKYDE
ncbi:Carbohydrate esterase family 16 protein [Mycena indigotica]|uniref:Carbohydrate esterase family 16 protein n=1 Tax=Mycena indigotica TaxID=2126181 RepID=A0A8H6W283_9AGAR|nr:Carbohydrate esterase family 16 protein [Mycena indigotica]KAF7298983.1 Carbohydrate esterase family 16 protein [Mycena indigotica]